jgi:hypothetical protein
MSVLIQSDVSLRSDTIRLNNNLLASLCHDRKITGQYILKLVYKIIIFIVITKCN